MEAGGIGVLGFFVFSVSQTLASLRLPHPPAFEVHLSRNFSGKLSKTPQAPEIASRSMRNALGGKLRARVYECESGTCEGRALAVRGGTVLHNEGTGFLPNGPSLRKRAEPTPLAFERSGEGQAQGSGVAASRACALCCLGPAFSAQLVVASLM